MLGGGAAPDLEANARGLAVLHHDALNVGFGDHPHIGALYRRVEECPGGAHPAAPMDAALGVGDALLGAPVVVRVARNAQGLGAAHEGLAQGIGLVYVGDRKRPCGAVVTRIAGADLVFTFDEVRQQVFVAPAAITHLRPGVEIRTLAAVVDVAVDGPGTAQGLAARLVDRAASQPRAAFALVHPVDGGVF